MKLKSSKLIMDETTFAPEIEMTISIPLDIMAGAKQLTDEEMALKLGTHLLSLMKSSKIQNT